MEKSGATATAKVLRRASARTGAPHSQLKLRWSRDTVLASEVKRSPPPLLANSACSVFTHHGKRLSKSTLRFSDEISVRRLRGRSVSGHGHRWGVRKKGAACTAASSRSPGPTTPFPLNREEDVHGRDFPRSGELSPERPSIWGLPQQQRSSQPPNYVAACVLPFLHCDPRKWRVRVPRVITARQRRARIAQITG